MIVIGLGWTLISGLSSCSQFLYQKKNKGPKIHVHHQEEKTTELTQTYTFRRSVKPLIVPPNAMRIGERKLGKNVDLSYEELEMFWRAAEWLLQVKRAQSSCGAKSLQHQRRNVYFNRVTKYKQSVLASFMVQLLAQTLNSFCLWKGLLY